MSVRILTGDCRDVLKSLPDESVHCIVTSPPYWGLRDYGTGAAGIGIEATLAEHVAALVITFREIKRVLRKDGTLWLNYGDAYSDAARNATKRAKDASDVLRPSDEKACERCGKLFNGGITRRFCSSFCGGSDNSKRSTRQEGLKAKDLMGLPWRIAFALQSDGWWLRSDIIWAKPNPMPESVTDRPTRAHEYIFLLTKSATYFYDAAAIAEPMAATSIARLAQDVSAQAGSERANGGAKTNGPMRAVHGKSHDATQAMRNSRSVWEIATQPFSDAHFATFPPELAERCIKAGCPAGGVVLDPFGGAGTVGLVADRLQRDAILIELNPEYAAMAERRITGDAPMFARVST